jgi:hypothetical protein
MIGLVHVGDALPAGQVGRSTNFNFDLLLYFNLYEPTLDSLNAPRSGVWKYARTLCLLCFRTLVLDPKYLILNKHKGLLIFTSLRQEPCDADSLLLRLC